jgi:hypothetical protein
MSSTGAYGGGWRCQRCGGYIPTDCTHNCPYTNWQPQPQPATSPATKIDTFISYERIATALERIAAALEEKDVPDFIAKTQGTPGWK